MDYNEIYKKLDKLSDNDFTILEKLGDMRADVAKTEIRIKTNTDDLKEHMRRTAILEDIVQRGKGFFLAIALLAPIVGGGISFAVHYILRTLYG
jgi:hypothetical protein